MDLSVLKDYSVKIKESKEIRTQTLPENYKNIKHECDSVTIYNSCARNNSQKLGKGIGGLRNQKMNGDYLDHSIITTGRNTDKTPGNLILICWGFMAYQTL